MQNNAIQLRQAAPASDWSDVRETLIAMRSAADGWLDSVSPFFSRISGMQVTRRVVARVYAVLFSLILMVVCLCMAPAVSVAAATVAVWFTIRINRFSEVNNKAGEE